MKNFVVLLCLVGATLAIRADKKLELDDIETDNLKSERKVKLEKQQTKLFSTSSYIQQQEYEKGDSDTSQPVKVPQYTPQPVKVPESYEQQAQVVVPQQYIQYQQILSRRPQLFQPQQQYLTDNSLGQYYSQQQQQQYYSPQQQYFTSQPQQYLYVQPSAAVEPKATVQYVMYIPAPAAPTAYIAGPKTESLIQSAQEYLNALSPTYPQEYYTTQPQQAAIQYIQPQQQQQEPPQVTEPPVEAPQKVEFVPSTPSKEPKSLLDSYVPSYLQVQYYKQQQAQRNSIQQDAGKGGAGVLGKGEVVKSHQQHGSASTYTYRYHVPSY